MKYMKMATALSAILTLGLVITPVSAESGKNPEAAVEKLMAKFDTNQDGQITQEEVAAVRAEFFANADADKDGALSLDEYKAAKERKHEKRFQGYFTKMDADNSGDLSLDEFLNAKKDRMKNIADPESELKDRFTKMDTDNNGALTAEELMEGKKKGICKGGKGDKDKGYDQDPEKKFAEKDTDGNGSISKEEFEGNNKIFDTFDGNKDGTITAEEIQAGMKPKAAE